MLALIICLIELIGIWGTTAIVLHMPQRNWHWLERPMAVLYVAGLVAVPIAVVGLFKDSRRVLAAVSLVLGLANFFVCSIPFAG
jgi:hypothetical protein